MSIVIKKNAKANAEVKTMADYALILEHVNGYSKSESRKLVLESTCESLYVAMLERNIVLFTTGSVVLQ